MSKKKADGERGGRCTDHVVRMESSFTPDIDLARRVLRNAVFNTTGLATDGMIILPKGIEFEGYMKNPIVACRHIIQPEGAAPANDHDPIVIGRTLAMHATDQELVADEVQFADSELGRQYAYLYGVNDKREPYMRAWSIEANRLESSHASFDQARRIAGAHWDENIAARVMRRQKDVPVWMRSSLYAVAAGAVGADRGALTRAFGAGVILAGELVARMDLEDAGESLAEVKVTLKDYAARIANLEGQIQALRGDGASAAARGDSEAVLSEVRDLLRIAKQMPQ